MDGPALSCQEQLEAVKARLAQLESALNWQTSCLNCSKLLESGYAETIRAERAESKLVNLRLALRELLAP